MKAVTLFVIICFLSGCAFKQGEAQTSSGVISSDSGLNVRQRESTVSYRLAAVPPEKATPIPIATETLVRDSATHSLRGENPLVVPAIVPDSLVVSMNISHLTETHSGFKGEIRIGDRFVREIPAAAFLVKPGSPTEVEFTVTELKGLLPPESQARVEVVVNDLDSRGRTIDTINFAFSTPPSKVGVKPFLPYQRFERQKQISIPDAYKLVVLPGDSRLELVGVLELNNDEKEAVAVDLPNRLAHSLSRVEIQTQVNVGECSYSISKSSNESKVNSEVRLLPLSSDIVRVALDTKDAEYIRARIGTGDVMQVGIYTADPSSFAFPDDRISNQSVPIRCTAQCQRGAEGDWDDLGKWGPDCHGCGGTPGNVGQNCYSCMRQHRDWCRWQDWRAWKDYTTVAGGYEYYLNFAPVPDGTGPGFYLASFLNQKVPGRARAVLTETIQVKK